MASDPGGGEGSWADDPGQSLECGLQHGDGGGTVEMVAGESSELCYVTGLSTKMSMKRKIKLEKQIVKLRNEIKQESDPKIKLMKSECLDNCTRELVIVKERLEEESTIGPKTDSWAVEKQRAARAQTARRRRETGVKEDTDSVSNIMEQGTSITYVSAATGESIVYDTTNNAENTAETCVPANKGLRAVELDCSAEEANASGASVSAQEGNSYTDIVSETPLGAVNMTTPGTVRETPLSMGEETPLGMGEEAFLSEVDETPLSMGEETLLDVVDETLVSMGEEILLSAVNDSEVALDLSVKTVADIVVSTLDSPPSTVSVSGGQVTPQSAADMAAPSGVSDPAAGERPSTDPSTDRPQYRRLFSNVTRTANPSPQRRNAVRIRYTGPEENLPSRVFIGKDLLKDFMRFKASEVFALIHVPSSRIYDVSFKLQQSLDLFWNIYNDTKENKMWEHLQVIPLSKPQVVTATILFQSEVVALADLQHWLSRQCVLRSLPAKIYDEEEIWNGGYTVKIQLIQDNSVTRHLPHSFYLGSERGICYYPGQPRLCHRCGGRHLAFTCSRIKCSLCGQFGHVKDECTGPVICNLCSGPGHTFRECPHAEHNKNTEICPEDMEEGLEEAAMCADVTPEAGHVSSDLHHGTSDLAVETKAPPVAVAPQVPPATEEPHHAKGKMSRKPVTKSPKPQPITSTEPTDPAVPACVDDEGFQIVKRKNTTADPSRKVTATEKPSEPELEITCGRYSALQEDQGEESQMEVPPSIPDEDPQDDDPDPSLSTKRWGTTGHSSGRRKKSKKFN